MGLLKRLRRWIERRGIDHGIELRVPAEKHGNRRGGWTLCPDGLGPESVVYSCGLGRNISFDLSLIDRYGLTVYGFDPTPDAIQWLRRQELPPQLRLMDLGVAGYDGQARFLPSRFKREPSHRMRKPEADDQGGTLGPVRRLSTLAVMLGHRRIDVLKLDIEGAEYDVLRDLLEGDLDVPQILVEFHHRFQEHGTASTNDIVRSLRRSGYRIFNISETGREYSFIQPRS